VNNLVAITYTTADARQQLLDALAGAADELGFALAYLGEAYERLDEQMADRLERELFLPVQVAYGRAKRTHAEFADRQRLPRSAFEPKSGGAPSSSVTGLLDAAVEAAARADSEVATLQDSLLPVEVGDAQLRAGLEEVRRSLADIRGRARELTRTLGR
jgi:hypothetical protein